VRKQKSSGVALLTAASEFRIEYCPRPQSRGLASLALGFGAQNLVRTHHRASTSFWKINSSSRHIQVATRADASKHLHLAPHVVRDAPGHCDACERRHPNLGEPQPRLSQAFVDACPLSPALPEKSFAGAEAAARRAARRCICRNDLDGPASWLQN